MDELESLRRQLERERERLLIPEAEAERQTRELYQANVDLPQVGHLRRIIDAVNLPMWVVSPEGTIHMANQAACSLLGYEEVELEYSPMDQLFGSTRPCPENEPVHVVHNAPTLFQTKQGELIPVLFSCSPIFLPNQTLEGTVCSAQDLSSFKDLERRLLQAREEAEGAQTSLSLFSPCSTNPRPASHWELSSTSPRRSIPQPFQTN